PFSHTSTCAVVVSKDNISLIGLATPGNPVTLTNRGGQDQGIAVAKLGAAGRTRPRGPRPPIAGLRHSGPTARPLYSHGVFLFCLDNRTAQDNATIDNFEYGIFPSHCGPGRATGNRASGSNDTGIYVGQSHDVRVDHNLSQGNVSGFEIENSSNVELDHNRA